MTIYILPYKAGSGSVSELRTNLKNVKRLLHKGNFKFGSPHSIVVNWGFAGVPYWGYGIGPNPRILNHWSKIPYATNKITTFQKFTEAGVPTLEWTTKLAEAQSWAKADSVVFCRKLVSSQEGKGIVVAETPTQLVPAPLYTRAFGKTNEYRVHVFKGVVIDYSIKKLKNGEAEKPDHNKYIRNLANGWVFSHLIPAGREAPKAAFDAAIKAVAAIGLDFGAVDLAVNSKGKVAVFEINTAPGIEGPTIERYVNAIQKYQASL